MEGVFLFVNSHTDWNQEQGNLGEYLGSMEADNDVQASLLPCHPSDSLSHCAMLGLRTALSSSFLPHLHSSLQMSSCHKSGEGLSHSDRAINGSSPPHQHVTWSHFTTGSR